ncbi:LOW QUALITY PROTEIN: hypothetical protein CsSME_00021570 [Camellia sinensis var. sinensis]
MASVTAKANSAKVTKGKKTSAPKVPRAHPPYVDDYGCDCGDEGDDWFEPVRDCEVHRREVKGSSAAEFQEAFARSVEEARRI